MWRWITITITDLMLWYFRTCEIISSLLLPEHVQFFSWQPLLPSLLWLDQFDALECYRYCLRLRICAVNFGHNKNKSFITKLTDAVTCSDSKFLNLASRCVMSLPRPSSWSASFCTSFVSMPSCSICLQNFSSNFSSKSTAEWFSNWILSTFRCGKNEGRRVAWNQKKIKWTNW